MEILILAAGYATRLYPLTLNRPKPLLQVGTTTILGHIFNKITQLEAVRRCSIVTNQKFYGHFKEWAGQVQYGIPIDVVNDETTTNENRLGAIKDIEFVIKKKAIQDDLLVVGGDNIFEFNLTGFVNFSNEHRPNTTLALFDIKDRKKAQLYGVVKLDSSNRVVAFQEKPAEPQSTLIATCVYYFPKEKLSMISDYLSSGQVKDAPGNYIKWSAEHDTVYGYVFKEPWYDIGDMASYQKADEEYKSKAQAKQ